MSNKIVKRNGILVDFNEEKIVKAIMKAMIATHNTSDEKDVLIAKNIANDIAEKETASDGPLTVETVQDMVEDGLRNHDASDVAGAYHSYRMMHQEMREHRSKLEQEVEAKLMASDVQNQNANVDEYSFSGRMGEARNVVTKAYALDHIMSDMARKNHVENRIYTHDLDSYAVGLHNCLSVPFDKLLKNGFQVRQTSIRGARSIGTAMQLVAVVFQLQSLQQFGGVSATHLDWTMVPYIRITFYKAYRDGMKYIAGKEMPEDLNEEMSIDDLRYQENEAVYRYAMDMTKRQTYQAVEAMFHNLNSLQSRSGGQLPFTSINFGTCTLPEGRMVIRALLENSLAGVGKLHLTPIFPCSIFQCMKGVNRKPGDPNYDLYQLALKSTSKRLYPNYANVDWSGNAGYDPKDPKTYFSTMGCRTANGYDINADPGVNPQTKDGRGNICPVTIILPTLAMEAGRDTEKFMQLLDEAIHQAKDQLIERYKWICSQPVSAAPFMWENGLMEGFDGKNPESAMRHGTLAIGELAIAETLQLLIGKDQTTPEGMKLAKRIEQLFKDRCAEFKKEYHLNFGVYYTPKHKCLWGLAQ